MIVVGKEKPARGQRVHVRVVDMRDQCADRALEQDAVSRAAVKRAVFDSDIRRQRTTVAARAARRAGVVIEDARVAAGTFGCGEGLEQWMTKRDNAGAGIAVSTNLVPANEDVYVPRRWHRVYPTVDIYVVGGMELACASQATACAVPPLFGPEAEVETVTEVALAVVSLI